MLPILGCSRRSAERTPVIVLTINGEEIDDEVTKVFSPWELTAGVKAVLRRASSPLAATARPPAVLRAGHLEVGVTIHEELVEQVWRFLSGETSTVTVHIRRLPGEIESYSSVRSSVCAVWGVGYRFEP